ncbi:MAG TPA: FUSC family protein [Rhizomicrobium sp.]|nr:FUSC family protein [Rhizomicrobium sp.]
MTTAWGRLGGLLLARRARLRFCLRLTVAAVLAFALMQFWALPLRGLWAVLTAVVVMQTSIGGSLRATTEYVVGTLVGAIYASVLGVLIPHETVAAMTIVLALAVAPLAYLAALSPSFRVAPFTAILVLILAGQFGESPIASAFIRLGEVVLGGAVALLVSVLIFPERAHGLGVAAAQRALDQLAAVLPRLLAGLTHQIPADDIHVMQDSVGAAVAAFQDLVDEARREQFIGLPLHPDPGPLSRTLLRLRHDLIILGRAAAKPLPENMIARLEPHLSAVAATIEQELRACSAALASRKTAPDNAMLEAAIDAYVAEVAALRRQGLTLPLSENEAEQLFAVGFALEQIRQNFRDLLRAIAEWSQAFAR